VLYRLDADDEWVSHEQLGWSLPFELGSLHCALGCRFRLRGLNATSYALRARIFNISAEQHHMLLPERRGSGPVESAESDIITTPRPPVGAPHPPAVRLELFLQPPLADPVALSMKSYVDGLIAQLTSSHFLVTSQRILPVEASSTGSFLILDVHPENIFTTTSGPDVSRLIQRMGVRADDLWVNVPPQEKLGETVDDLPERVVAAVYGRFHHIDPRFGLWLQAVEGTITQQATRASRLWPRLHDQKMAPQKGTAVLKDLQGTTQRSPPGDASNPGQVWWTNPFDEDDDGVELEEALDRQVLLDSNELEQLLGEELNTEEGRHEPILKATVLLLTLVMLCAGICNILRSSTSKLGLGSWSALGGSGPRSTSSVQEELAFGMPSRCVGFIWSITSFVTYLHSIVARGLFACSRGAGLYRMGISIHGSHAPLPTSDEEQGWWRLSALRGNRSGLATRGDTSGYDRSPAAQLEAWLAIRRGRGRVAKASQQEMSSKFRW